MKSRGKIFLASVLGVMALGAVFAATAPAHPGPFWRQRQVGEGGNGIKISEASPEKITSKSGVSLLKAPEIPLTIECAEDKDEGHIYNNKLQGQGKIKVTYSKCISIGNECKVEEPIVFESNLHLAWKWNGTKAQLAQGKQKALGQTPDILFTHGELGESEIKNSEEFVEIKLSGCGLLSGSQKVTGYESAVPTPGEAEAFSSEPTISFTAGKHLQHYWNGTEQVGIETQLKVKGFKATFESSDTEQIFGPTGGQQEIAIFEN